MKETSLQATWKGNANSNASGKKVFLIRVLMVISGVHIYLHVFLWVFFATFLYFYKENNYGNFIFGPLDEEALPQWRTLYSSKIPGQQILILLRSVTKQKSSRSAALESTDPS